MEKQKNNKEIILKELQEEQAIFEKYLDEFEEEIKNLKKSNLKKELLLEELKKYLNEL